MGQLPLSNVSTKDIEIGEKGCFFGKSKEFKKTGLLGPTHRIKNNMFSGFREKGGGKI